MTSPHSALRRRPPALHHLLDADDPLCLVDALRTSERRDDHDEATSLCRSLLDAGAWPAVWHYGERLLARAESAQRTGLPDIARQAARVFSMLAGVTGQLASSAALGANDDGSPELAPNPLAQYVRALQLAMPGRWFMWLSDHTEDDVVLVEPSQVPAWVDTLRTLTPVVRELLERAGVAVNIRVEVDGRSDRERRYPTRALEWPDGETFVLLDGRCQMAATAPRLPVP